MKLKQVIPFRQQPRLRLALGILLTLALAGVILARQQGWIASPPASSQTVSCPDLNAGCSFRLKARDYRVAVQNGTLHLYGPATGVQASWPREAAVWMNPAGQDHWTRAAPNGSLPLTLLINRHQVLIEPRQP